MQLKSYQERTIVALRSYLAAIREAQTKHAVFAELAQASGIENPYKWDSAAWKTLGRRDYIENTNGINEPLPAVCFQVPTGGGKTLLAVKAIDALRNHFGSQAGFVLWIVPTEAIYRQTITALRDKNHPYRQLLDLSSGGKTKIIEKQSLFRPSDVQEYLVIMVLMLPSAARQTKETLRIFRDRSGFEAFFPREDDYAAHKKLLQAMPNLDTFGQAGTFFGQIIKTSLGNTLRLLKPIIILDEGHKAYSPLAQATLRDFNPCFVLELSATPNEKRSNILVKITGRDVHREGMIKLDLHLHTQGSNDWRDVVRTTINHREQLEQIARDYEANSNSYIRPINLIQVERTGKNQRDGEKTHAENVREFLITSCNIPPQHIAIKSSEKDDLESIDLLSRTCSIRYIITSRALQEGWDCPFAYILTILSNPSSANGLTQLVGRILRQPYGIKTNRPELDESYVYCYRVGSTSLLSEIQRGLHNEGLSDMANHVRADSSPTSGSMVQESFIRDAFRPFAGKVYLPCFVMVDTYGPRSVEYEIDILSRIEWNNFDLSLFDTLQPHAIDPKNSVTRVGLNFSTSATTVTDAEQRTVDPLFISRQLNEIVPNPWIAFEIVKNVLQRLRTHWTEEQLVRSIGHVIEELRKQMIKQRRDRAKNIFIDLVQRGELQFHLIESCQGTAIPDRVITHGVKKLVHANNDQLNRSLFDLVYEEDFNGLEKSVALYLDQHHWVLAWYRNLVGSGYKIQAWREHSIYSDFVVLGHHPPEATEPVEAIQTVYVLETKGNHLKNDDTNYKQEVFAFCNTLSKQRDWSTIEDHFDQHTVHFQVVFEDEWEKMLNEMFAGTP